MWNRIDIKVDIERKKLYSELNLIELDYIGRLTEEKSSGVSQTRCWADINKLVGSKKEGW